MVNTMTTNNWGIPGEAELEQFANSLFPDFDAAHCADGTESLLTSGDTSVISEAAAKSEASAGSFSGGYYAEYENLANELMNGAGLSEEQAVPTGYSPSVMSEAMIDT